MRDDMKRAIGNEKIFYEGKPDKACFIFESIFNPLLPIAIIWGIFDFGIFGRMIGVGAFSEMSFFIIPFFILHLMPVWIYLGGVLFAALRHRNIYYAVTDRAIYVSGGIFTKTLTSKPFAELSHIDLHRGFFDQIFKVGDIIATTSQFTSNGKAAVVKINSISDYAEVYSMVKKLQTDIYTDVMYPNAKRPDTNPGYNSEYEGL